MVGKYSRVYLRREFDGKDAVDAGTMALLINFDDAFIAFLTGHEILRQNVGQGRGADAENLDSHEADGYEAFEIEGVQDLLQPGRNVLALEGHNDGVGSSDFSLEKLKQRG